MGITSNFGAASAGELQRIDERGMNQFVGKNGRRRFAGKGGNHREVGGVAGGEDSGRGKPQEGSELGFQHCVRLGIAAHQGRGTGTDAQIFAPSISASTRADGAPVQIVVAGRTDSLSSDHGRSVRSKPLVTRVAGDAVALDPAARRAILVRRKVTNHACNGLTQGSKDVGQGARDRFAGEIHLLGTRLVRGHDIDRPTQRSQQQAMLERSYGGATWKSSAALGRSKATRVPQRRR